MISELLINLLRSPFNILEIVDALEVSIEFIDLVIYQSGTKVNFAEVDDAQLASEGYLCHPVLLMGNL